MNAKAILQFDLSDADQKLAHLRCVKSTDMAITLWEVSVNLRKHFVNDFLISEDTLDKVISRINEIYEENNINVDEIG